MNKFLGKLALLFLFLPLSACSPTSSEMKPAQQQNPQPAQVSESVQSIQGSSIAIDQILEKENLIAFFYTYGTPCLNTFPELQKVAAACPNLKIVGIESTGKSDSLAQNIIRDMHITFPLLSTTEGKKTDLFQLYQVRSLPTILFVNQNKQVVPYIGQMTEELIRSKIKESFSVSLPEC